MDKIWGECTPKTAEEKLMVLLGRMQAFKAYIDASEYSIDKNVAAEMLGLKANEEKNKCCNCKGEGNVKENHIVSGAPEIEN